MIEFKSETHDFISSTGLGLIYYVQIIYSWFLMQKNTPEYVKLEIWIILQHYICTVIYRSGTGVMDSENPGKRKYYWHCGCVDLLSL